MPPPIDPSEGLASFQQALVRSELRLQRCELDRDINVFLNRPNDELRLTYVRLVSGAVTAFVNFSSCEPIEGLPCFQVGVAVPPRLRGLERARDVIRAAIDELRHGFGRNGVRDIYVEAIVCEGNVAFRRGAEAVISPTPKEGQDEQSGGVNRQAGCLGDTIEGNSAPACTEVDIPERCCRDECPGPRIFRSPRGAQIEIGLCRSTRNRV